MSPMSPRKGIRFQAIVGHSCLIRSPTSCFVSPFKLISLPGGSFLPGHRDWPETTKPATLLFVL